MNDLRHDAPAGIVTLFVAVPLCLGISPAGGLSLFAGLIARIIDGIVVGTLRGSALVVSGVAAGLVVIVFDAIHGMGSFRSFLLAVFFAGCLQVLLDSARADVLGSLQNFEDSDGRRDIPVETTQSQVYSLSVARAA